MRDTLYLYLYLIIFINGFESGGYQASLWKIGESFDLSNTSMGLYASLELLATMIAPIVLGNWADRIGKKKSLLIFLFAQFLANLFIIISEGRGMFLLGIFLLGLTTSALQYISIATLLDYYPKTGHVKVGYITSLFAVGALIAPLLVHFYQGQGYSWRMLFVIIMWPTLFTLFGLFLNEFQTKEFSGFPEDMISYRDHVKSKELRNKNDSDKKRFRGEFYLPGAILLSLIMLIYVGFENGFTFFVDSYMINEMGSSSGQFILSLFWASMIPARIIVGHIKKNAKKGLIVSCGMIPVMTWIIISTNSPSWMDLLSALLGLFCGSIYPYVLNMSYGFSGGYTATMTGMITAATGIGGVVFTTLTGVLSDIIGFRKSFGIIALFFGISILAAIVLAGMKGNDSGSQN